MAHPKNTSASQTPAAIAPRMDEFRRRIDRLDAELVRLLNARAACADEIGRLKDDVGIEIYQPEREQDVLAHVRTVNTGPLDQGAITRLFERIIDESRRLERQAHAGPNADAVGSQSEGGKSSQQGQ